MVPVAHEPRDSIENTCCQGIILDAKHDVIGGVDTSILELRMKEVGAHVAIMGCGTMVKGTMAWTNTVGRTHKQLVCSIVDICKTWTRCGTNRFHTNGI